MSHNDYPSQGERDDIARRGAVAAHTAGLARKEVAEGRPFTMGAGSVTALAEEVRSNQGNHTVLTAGKKLVVGRGPAVEDFALTRRVENWGPDASSAVTRAVHVVAMEKGRDVATALVSNTDAQGVRKFALIELPFGAQNPDYKARTGKQVSETGTALPLAHDTDFGSRVSVEGNGLRAVSDSTTLTIEAAPDANGQVPEIVTLMGGFDQAANPMAADLQAMLSAESLFSTMGRTGHDEFTPGHF